MRKVGAEEAIALLDSALEFDDAEPLDHAWLRLQHARACAEIGRIEEARATALDVQGVRNAYANDITASAISGAAAVLIFSTANWGSTNAGTLAAGIDTTAHWWRALTISWGLQDSLNRTFKSWARDSSVRVIRGSDEANNQLLAASLMANNLGNHDAWRHAATLLAQNALIRLDRRSDPSDFCSELRTLIRTGDKSTLKLAVERTVRDGPASAVRLAASEVDLAAATRTTAPASLALLRYGGDVLDQPTANRSVEWLLAQLENPAVFTSRTSPSYVLAIEFVDTLTRAVRAANDSIQRTVAEYVVQLPGQADQALATSWARLVSALPAPLWGEDLARRAAEAANCHHRTLRLELLGVAAHYDETIALELANEVRSGSLDALGALGDVRAVDDDLAEMLISKISELVDRDVRNARSSTWGFGGIDCGHALAMFNVWHPRFANWDPLAELITEPLVQGSQKQGAIVTLARLADHLSDDVAARFGAIAIDAAQRAATSRALHFDPFSDPADEAGAATDLAVALGAFDDAATDERLLEMLSGNSAARKWAARLARRVVRPEDVGVLATLANDIEPDVRATASAGLASIVAAGHGGAIAHRALLAVTADPGTLTPIAVAGTLRDAPRRGELADEVLAKLRGHMSAAVRASVARAEVV